MLRFAVIGLGRFGTRLARALSSAGAEVIAIDQNRRPVDEMRDEVTIAVRLDSTDEEAMKAQGVANVDCAIVGIGHEFESSALTVAILKKLEVKRIIARAENDVQARILASIGADATISPEKESAIRWAQRLMLPNLREFVELGEDHSIIYAAAPAIFHNKSLKELNLRNGYGVNLVAIKREVTIKTERANVTQSAIIEVPDAGTIVLPGDILIIVGSNENLARMPSE